MNTYARTRNDRLVQVTDKVADRVLCGELGANMVREDSSDPDLVKITETWPELPEHIKAAIKALIQTQKKGD